MFNFKQLRDLVILPALVDLQLYSESAVDLMLFTCANETQGGTYLKQIKGPALGIFQMEPATYNDLWANFIMQPKGQRYRLILLSLFECSRMPSEDRLVYDLRFASAMTRLLYYRVSESLPASNDLNGLWLYYKTYYNTDKGAADYRLAIEAYHRFVL